MEGKKYIEVNDLVVYQLARKLSALAWKIYESLTWQDKKIMGDQFISATDSVGANIVEGYGRYHFRDKIRFYYISRASLNESAFHWLSLLFERNKISKEELTEMTIVFDELQIKLNNFITVTYKQIENKKDENL